mmetsp:Transcript_45828/g.103235  ORF Transcript_45828/g.103235 Transcript_45828/m.103235 type:complete len:266 (-) Transcript_45828:650-1447(-)
MPSMRLITVLCVLNSAQAGLGFKSPGHGFKPPMPKRTMPASGALLHGGPRLRTVVTPLLSYGGLAATAAGAATVAWHAAGASAAWAVGGSIVIPAAFVLGEFLLLGGQIVGKLMGGKPADASLRSMVNEVARQAHFDPPKHVFEIPTREMNAFAAGFRKADTCVAVTSGLRSALTDRELKAVIAHEMGHLLAQDVVKNMHLSVAVAGLGGLYSAGRQLLSSSPANRKKKEGESGRLSLGLGLIGAGLVSRAAGMLQRLEPAALSR